jgi:hypothetical protein
MRRFALAAVAACLLASAARAQSATWAFTAVDGVRLMGGYLYVAGVLEGASAATEEKLEQGNTTLDLAECQRFAMISMSRPGYYRLELTAFRVTPTGGLPYFYVSACALRRANP